MPISWRRRGRGSTPAGAFLAALLAVLFLVAGCSTAASTTPSTAPIGTATIQPAATGTPTPAPQPTFPLALSDDEGTTVTLPAVPHRIVSLSPGTTEIAFALGDGSRVVGVTSSDDYPPAVSKLPQVATYNGADIEKIVGLRADLVLAGGNGLNKPSDIAKLRQLGIPVLVVYAADVNGLLKDITLIGTALGEASRAQQLTAAMQGQISAISTAAQATGTRPRVFYEEDATTTIYGFADHYIGTDMITLAGGDPITSGSTTVFSIPLEKLIAADPEVILLGDAAYGTTVASVGKRPGWSVMTAVKTGAIRPIDDTVVTRPGPRIVIGLGDLALAIHPDLVLPALAPLPTWTDPSTP